MILFIIPHKVVLSVKIVVIKVHPTTCLAGLRNSKEHTCSKKLLGVV